MPTKYEAQNSAAFAALRAEKYFEVSKFPLHEYSIGGPLLVLKKEDDIDCLRWCKESREEAKAVANLMLQMKKRFGFLHGVPPANEGYEKRLAELFKMYDLSEKFTTIVAECNDQGFLKLNPGIEVDNFDWVFKFNDLVFETKTEVTMMPKMKNKFHRNTICSMVRCDYVKIVREVDPDARPKLILFDSFASDAHGAVRYDCLFDTPVKDPLTSDAYSSTTESKKETPQPVPAPVTCAPVTASPAPAKPVQLPLNPLNESSSEIVGAEKSSYESLPLIEEISVVAMMASIKAELSKAFPDPSVVYSEGFAKLFEEAWPAEKVSEAFKNWCRKCEIFVSIQTIANGWAFFMNNIKVMDRFSAAFNSAQRDFHRQIVTIMFKSDFVKVDSLYEIPSNSAKFFTFHESHLDAPRGSRRYDALCRSALAPDFVLPISATVKSLIKSVFSEFEKRPPTRSSREGSPRGSAPPTRSVRDYEREREREREEKEREREREERKRELERKEMDRDRKRDREREDREREKEREREIEREQELDREYDRRVRDRRRDVSPARERSRSSSDSRSTSPSRTAEEVAVLEPIKPPLPKFVAEVGPKVVGKSAGKPSGIEKKLAEVMLSLKLLFMKKYGVDPATFQINQIRSVSKQFPVGITIRPTSQRTDLYRDLLSSPALSFAFSFIYIICIFHFPFSLRFSSLSVIKNQMAFFYQDPKPNFEGILKEEFLKRDMHFESNVSDALDEGKFVFEMIVYCKCDQCVFECPHYGDDKLLAFRFVFAMNTR